jgi:hypothetical protein
MILGLTSSSSLNRKVDRSELVFLRHTNVRFFFIFEEVLPQLAY